MVNTPSESTLELNVTHEMLTDLDKAFDRTTVKSPTRLAESDLGFDTQLEFALRTQFQYKRPQSSTSRGVAFQINGDQVSTLRMRDPFRVAFLACPVALREDDVPDSLARTAFVDVHAVNSFTSRLYIPDPSVSPIGTVDGQLKIKNGDYYGVPKEGIYRWQDIFSDIRSRNLGMIARRGVSPSQDLQRFRQRLAKLANLYNPYPRGGTGNEYLTDGGEEPDERILNEDFATDLVDFAREQRQQFYTNTEREIEDETSAQVDREGLRDTIIAMEDSRHPATHRIGGSSEHILEDGQQDQPLKLA